ncbi:hypothetical protein Poli38472_014490 [Pythium oligandrum]|uniref:Cyclic nucleotide-binding domain-containing protein n=1 Tax=Pythium oligandrum TaxID=41045 RepID=A0A8K1CCU0_PYTOL|nr:hypothetical protein Poli38472_014490 [Pythium oligandrum]|eukprot:TMW61029.1 hypothetical protein Poli38472_014490 [Pythium oligandrum]
MEVVPTPSTLPLLAVPSGDTAKFRKRDNELDELEEEALRVQIRQHLGTSLYVAKPPSPQARRRSYRDAESESTSMTAALTASLHTEAFDFSALSAFLTTPSRVVRCADLRKFLLRLLWVSDEDMEEEINEHDPKIIAGKKFLKGVEAFAMLTENELAQLVGLSELRSYKTGDVVVDDERDADGLYIVLTGTATRFTVVDAHTSEPHDESNEDQDDDDLNTEQDNMIRESFGYQEHFGTVISPTEAATMHARRATTVVATAELLECIWLPESVIRMLNVQSRMEYEFVLVLHNHRNQSETQHRQQEEIMLNLLRAGLHVTVLANTRHTTHCIVLLLSAPLWLLAREDKLLSMDRVAVDHAAATVDEGDDDYASHAETMTASDRIAAFASILTRSASDKPPGVGLRGVENNQDSIVRDVFPLHDPSMTDFILSTWFKESHSTSTKRLFLLRIKDYFGLRIAFFTAFVRLYNAALVYPVNVGCMLWVFWRWIDYRSYIQALGLYGLYVAFLWAPSFLKRWLRYQNSLLVEWNLVGTTEVEQPNPEFRDFVIETINVANDGEPPDYVQVKTYDHRRRWPKYAIFGVFCAASLVLLFIFVSFYVQWYIIAVMTPMCTDPRCPEFLDKPGGCESHCHYLFAQGKDYAFMQQISSCAAYCDLRRFDRGYYMCDEPLVGCFTTERGVVGTARWFYVLVQGIVLGLTLDIVFLAVFEAIASGFNRWENYATELENEKRFIEKIFLFNWVGYFYWFFLLAFVYVPYGARVQEWVRDHIDGGWVLTLNHNVRFSRYWIDGLITMDSAFVTPMIVTQALNLVINTFVPFLLRRAILRARESYHVRKDQLLLSLRQKTTTMRKTPESESSTVSNDGGADVTPSSTTEPWIPLADLSTLHRPDVGAMLAQREPIKAEHLDEAVRALFAAISTHDRHMDEICGGELHREDLDVYQRTSYDWLDRVTRNLEERGHLKGVWTTSSTTSSLHLALITHWQCRNYDYTADRILEESSMPIYSPFGDLLHLAIQFSYTIMFSVVWPFCCLCSFCRNFVALRFDAIKMTIDCKRAVPRRTVGIGSWFGAFLFEILIAQLAVPGLFVYVSGQLDAFFEDCTISKTRYGPDEQCVHPSTRLATFCTLENTGIALCFVVYLKKSDISRETSIKIVEHSRKVRHHLRKSIRMIGESVLVRVTNPTKASHTTATQRRSETEWGMAVSANNAMASVSSDPASFFSVDLSDLSDEPSRPGSPGRSTIASAATTSTLLRRRTTTATSDLAMVKAQLDTNGLSTATSTESSTEWREGTVAWVRNGRVKVNFSGGRQLSGGGLANAAMLQYNEHEMWLTPNDRYVLLEPTPVKVFSVGMSALLASKKFGRWTEATITGLDNRDRFGRELAHTPNEMHFRFIEAQNLRTHAIRNAALIDPYCVLTAGGFRHTTSVKRRTLNPIWDEDVVFPLSERELYGEIANIESLGSAAASASSSRHTSYAGLDKQSVSVTTATLHAAAAAVHPSASKEAGAGVGLGSPRRTLKLSVVNNDQVAMGECIGEVEIDLNQFRSGQKHRMLIPLSQKQKRHIWTLDAIQSVMRKQALGAGEYPMLGLPHILIEMQWIDTRLPTKVTVQLTTAQQRKELVLSRKFCETNLCYGIPSDKVVHGRL